MRTLKWSDAYSVRIAELDAEHKEVFELVNALAAAAAAHEGTDAVTGCVERLRARVDKHFRHEERLMRGTGYSLAAWHKRQHDAARSRSAAVDPADPEGVNTLLGFVMEWMDGHIRIADRMFAAYLQVYRSSHRSLTAGAR